MIADQLQTWQYFDSEIFRPYNGMIKTVGTAFGSPGKRFALSVSHSLTSSPTK